MLFDKFDNRIIVTGVIEAIGPIHIGASSSVKLDPTEADNSVLKDSRGLPVIPGSSIKGVVRSEFEALERGIYESMNQAERNQVKKALGISPCDIFKNCCVDDRVVKNWKGVKGMSNSQLANKIYEESCIACRLFGGKKFAGKLKFKDCFYKGSDITYEFRDGVGINRYTGAALAKAKYNFEVVPAGSQFDFYMQADNLAEEQKEQLQMILSMMESGELSLGGMTSRGLGRFKLIVQESITITKDNYCEHIRGIAKTDDKQNSNINCGEAAI